jgi:hypothetical protein
LKFGCEVWVLKKRDEQRSEAAQMKFLRHLLGITKLDKQKKSDMKSVYSTVWTGPLNEAVCAVYFKV